MQEIKKKIEKAEETVEIKYGNMTFQVASKHTGNVPLEYLIKRLILEEAENSRLH